MLGEILFYLFVVACLRFSYVNLLGIKELRERHEENQEALNACSTLVELDEWDKTKRLSYDLPVFSASLDPFKWTRQSLFPRSPK